MKERKYLVTFNRQRIVFYGVVINIFLALMSVRLFYLMVFKSDYYLDKALTLHQRERVIKAERGLILDRNGVTLAANKTVCTVSVIYSQISDADYVIEILSKELSLAENIVRTKVEKISSREKIASNVDKETGDRIRAYNLSGVKVDEDYKRYYPYGSLASKVIGFTGADNQGIIGLEVRYDEVLMGTNGMILTKTDARGVEFDDFAEDRIDPIAGDSLTLTIDYNIQMYATQLAKRTLTAKQSNYVSIIVMNPKNGEIYAMVNEPEFDLNKPFELVVNTNIESDKLGLSNNVDALSAKEKQDLLNKMWRNQSINDTYEPGSTFKIITATAGLETKEVTVDSRFSCPGFKVVENWRIRCHKIKGHGAENFVEATQNSCNPVFIEVGLRVGAQRYYSYMERLGLLDKTGIDLPGEAKTIMHKLEDIGIVELATMSFGQSFQITPIRLLTSVCAVINGGNLVTPHFVKNSESVDGTVTEYFYDVKEDVIKDETSETMKTILKSVVTKGGAKKCYIEGYSIGGKTATSQKLPRGSAKYIASFIGFWPAEDPELIAMCIIDEPKGIYYGGTIATPVIRELFENILPYMANKTD